MPFLSIIMPVYNEARTVRRAIESVLAVDYPCETELIVVNDGSVDETAQIIAPFEAMGVRIFQHPLNQGKGAAVRSGVELARGTHLIILDADLEYAPADIPAMLMPVIHLRADHVFGTRVFGMNTRFQSFKFAMGGRFTTFVANLLYDSCLTDMHTCLKLLPIEDFRNLGLAEDGFGLDTQLTARLLRVGVRPYEVPISYNARSVIEGKKISYTDGLQCLLILAKVRIARRPLMPALDEIRTAVVSLPAPESGGSAVTTIILEGERYPTDVLAMAGLAESGPLLGDVSLPL